MNSSRYLEDDFDLDSCSNYSYEVSDCGNGNHRQYKDLLLFHLNLILILLRNLLDYIYESKWLILFSLLMILMLYVLYKTYLNPIYFKKELTEIGFEHIPKGPDRDRKITRAQNSRKIGEKIPPPYPNGWFAVAESRDVKKGDVVAVDALGQNLCVYRGQDGVVRCVDAYCPHLGANLAVGGNVTGNCIECPFHKWRFNEEGSCVSVPGIEKVPKGVSIKKWRTVEVDGAVWIWHDAEGRPPKWEITDANEVKWGYRGRNEFTVSAHIQEIPENGADVAHLNAVHSPSMISSLGEKYPLLYRFIGRHVWTATWSRGDDHTATMSLTHDYKILSYHLCHIDVTVIQIGPGHVRLLLQLPVGPVLVSQSVTPIGPSLQKVVHRMFSPWYNGPAAAMLVKSEGHMFERDIAIWNSKRFVAAPTYVRTDKTIRSFRQWYSQFYSENSITFRDAMRNTLEW